MECRVDDGPWVPCSSPFTVTVTPGEHTFQVRFVDAAGNAGPVTTRVWRADAHGDHGSRRARRAQRHRRRLQQPRRVADDHRASRRGRGRRRLCARRRLDPQMRSRRVRRRRDHPRRRAAARINVGRGRVTIRRRGVRKAPVQVVLSRSGVRLLRSRGPKAVVTFQFRVRAYDTPKILQATARAHIMLAQRFLVGASRGFAVDSMVLDAATRRRLRRIAARFGFTPDHVRCEGDTDATASPDHAATGAPPGGRRVLVPAEARPQRSGPRLSHGNPGRSCPTGPAPGAPATAGSTSTFASRPVRARGASAAGLRRPLRARLAAPARARVTRVRLRAAESRGRERLTPPAAVVAVVLGSALALHNPDRIHGSAIDNPPHPRCSAACRSTPSSSRWPPRRCTRAGTSCWRARATPAPRRPRRSRWSRSSACRSRPSPGTSTPRPSPSSPISIALEIGYFALLAAAYARADLGVVYPIARGAAPVLVLAAAAAARPRRPERAPGRGRAPRRRGRRRAPRRLGARGVGRRRPRRRGRRDDRRLHARRRRRPRPRRDLPLPLPRRRRPRRRLRGELRVPRRASPRRGRSASPRSSARASPTAAPAAARASATPFREGPRALRRAIDARTAAIAAGMAAAFGLTLAALELADPAPVAAIRESSVVIAALAAPRLLGEAGGKGRVRGRRGGVRGSGRGRGGLTRERAAQAPTPRDAAPRARSPADPASAARDSPPSAARAGAERRRPRRAAVAAARRSVANAPHDLPLAQHRHADARRAREPERDPERPPRHAAEHRPRSLNDEAGRTTGAGSGRRAAASARPRRSTTTRRTSTRPPASLFANRTM